MFLLRSNQHGPNLENNQSQAMGSIPTRTRVRRTYRALAAQRFPDGAHGVTRPTTV
jgi:hypothetical protein